MTIITRRAALPFEFPQWHNTLIITAAKPLPQATATLLLKRLKLLGFAR